MGEIADALRRAQGVLSPKAPERRAEARAVKPEEPPESSQDDAAPWDALPPIGKCTADTLDPTDPAIAFRAGGHVEASRKLAVKVRAELEARGAKSVAIVSAVRDEGKTTVAINLALALASLSQGREVALLDLDLRKPSVSKVLGLEASAGIEDVLQGRASPADVQVSLRRPEIDLYPALVAQNRSHELLVTQRFAQLIALLERRYATVVVDTPPVLLVPDASLILERVPACIPVARAGTTRVRSYREMVETLPRRVVLGGLLNGVRVPNHYSDDAYYGSENEEDEEDSPSEQPARPKRRGRRARER